MSPERQDVGVCYIASAAFWEPNVQSQLGAAYTRGVDLVEELAYRLPGGDLKLIRRVRPLIGEDRWLAHLRRFAMSNLPPAPDASSPIPPAVFAVSHLADAGPEGLAILRELYEGGLITNADAEYWAARAVGPGDCHYSVVGGKVEVWATVRGTGLPPPDGYTVRVSDPDGTTREAILSPTETGRGARSIRRLLSTPGRYMIEVEAPGYAPWRAEGVELTDTAPDRPCFTMWEEVVLSAELRPLDPV